MATAIGARGYYESSALLNEGVDQTFEAATRAAMLVRNAEAAGAGVADKRERMTDEDKASGGCGCVIA